MSHQPSNVDNVRSAASAATHAIAETLDPETKDSGAKDRDNTTKDSQGQTVDKGSYKDQLNKAAYGNLEPTKEKEDETMVEKVMSYIPGMSSKPEGPKDTTKQNPDIVDDGTAPTRPIHDVQVEEFIKDQYKSKKGDDMAELGEDKTK